ncbi:ankyrin, partial [Acephala macrosclerotiorum]
RAILDWLTPVDYATQQHDFISQRQSGTGQWLLDSSEFQAWLRTDKQTLFCPGIPGAGKTIITATVIDDLITRFQNDPSIGIAYLYCDFRRQEEQNAEDLILNLLKQLSQQHSILPDSLKSLYDQYKDKRTQLSLDKILETLHEIAAIYSRIFIIVDALDECQAFDGCRMKFLSEISKFQAKCNANLFVTSRNIPEITERFKLSISLEIRASDEDVRMYLDSRLSKSESDVIKGYREEITIAITKAVDGMFLLAHLHFESVKTKRTLKKIKDALKCLPTGLKAYDRAYDEAMERITGQDPDSKELAENVLSWITCANRRLTTSELQCALAVEVGDQELEEENLPQIRDMVSVCAGLVTIDDESNVIRLVHYTTQEYFERRQDKWFPNAEIGIAKTCITYLLFDVFGSGFCLTDEDFEDRLLSNPLYDYAARNWGHHARVALDEEVTKLILVFLQSMPKISASSQAGMASKDSVGYSQKVPQQITGLHLAAYFRLSDVILTLIINGHSLNVMDSYHQTPLLLAAANGYNAAVSVLIALDGIDINSKDKHGRTPLSFAAEGGHKEVVNQFLTKDDVDLDSKDEYGQTPL